jgi:phosphatidylserine decarboxylase
VATPTKRALSHLVGWLADRKVPTPLRAPIYRTYCRLTGADVSEARPPLHAYPSLGAFFVRELISGARPIEPDPALLPSPVDGTVQALDPITQGTILQAKGRPYPIAELLGPVGADIDLEGGCAWTIYLSPRDYHRIHSPETASLTESAHLPGARHSVAPKVLERRQVLSINERVALRLETERGPLLLVLVGALNVGRIRVVGLTPEHTGPIHPPLERARGAELGRFEMGSTIVLISPPGGPQLLEGLKPGDPVRLGQAIGSYPT